jgi:hypothetical protein|tara:strand:+ start:708 stop:980 length:273 start_codon:yes stop_codon:yes gene_type:complete
MPLDNNNDLLREQLGKGTVEIFTTAAQSGKNFYAVHFPVTSVISAITVANGTGESALHTTIGAGVTLFMNITAITLTSGIGIGYDEGVTS